MLQNQEIFQLSCNYKEHQNQHISAICLRKDCKRQSALCQRCMFPFHKSCEDHITYLEDLKNRINAIETEYIEVDQLIESLIKQIREFQKICQQTLQSVLGYKQIQNMTNLNNFGMMLRQNKQINLHQMRTGVDLIAKIIKQYIEQLQPQEQIDAELWYIKSLESFDKDEYNKTIEFIDKALNLNPQSDVYWNIKGRALRNLNKNEEAIQCLNAALKINPKNDYAWNNKGSALRNLNKNQEAIQCLDAALQINPNNEIAWNNKGSVLNQLTKYDEAIQCLDVALKINPNTDSAWNNKGDSLNQLNRFEEAVRCYDESLNLKPKFSTYIKKSFPLEHLNKLNEAEDCLKKALELNSNDMNTIARLKFIQAKQNK